VAQTGVQLLTGLLLTVPFQSRSGELVTHQRVLYLVATTLSVVVITVIELIFDVVLGANGNAGRRPPPGRRWWASAGASPASPRAPG
jgi:hypothetical protein